MGETPFDGATLLNEFDELARFGALGIPEPEPGLGVIGNKLPGPAFIPIREAVRAGSSVEPGGNPFGHVRLLGGGCVRDEPAPELFGGIGGNEPFGGQLGNASNGEPVLAGGIELRYGSAALVDIESAFGFGT